MMIECQYCQNEFNPIELGYVNICISNPAIEQGREDCFTSCPSCWECTQSLFLNHLIKMERFESDN